MKNKFKYVANEKIKKVEKRALTMRNEGIREFYTKHTKRPYLHFQDMHFLLQITSIFLKIYLMRLFHVQHQEMKVIFYQQQSRSI
jgi:hypothetical protein